MNIKIGNHTIGLNHSPFIIAEMSGNHNQSLERALQIVDAAALAGAHAIKLQTYSADTITIKGAYTINDENSLWNGKELYDLYQNRIKIGGFVTNRYWCSLEEIVSSAWKQDFSDGTQYYANKLLNTCSVRAVRSF